MPSSTVQHFYNTLVLHTFAFAKPLLWTVRVTQFTCHHNQSSGFCFFFWLPHTPSVSYTHSLLSTSRSFRSLFFVLLYHQTFITLCLASISCGTTLILLLTFRTPTTQQNTMTTYRAYLHIHSHPPCITTSPPPFPPSLFAHPSSAIVGATYGSTEHFLNSNSASTSDPPSFIIITLSTVSIACDPSNQIRIPPETSRFGRVCNNISVSVLSSFLPTAIIISNHNHHSHYHQRLLDTVVPRRQLREGIFVLPTFFYCVLRIIITPSICPRLHILLFHSTSLCSFAFPL